MDTLKRYPVNEVFLSVQGEGARMGTLNVFVRFAGCNQTCRRETHGFDCDTEFVSKEAMPADEIATVANALWPGTGAHPSFIFTGGEPLLHLDMALVEAFLALDERAQFALETNGSLAMPALPGPWWVCCSPKVAEHAIRLDRCDELRYVRAGGQGLPRSRLEKEALRKFLSPAWGPDGPEPGAIETCIELIKEDPSWHLSLQTHKLLSIR